SAEQGYSIAMYNLGYMYQCGRGVPKDYKEAVKWFKKSGE
ncbi:MAG: SEL1-like repeat protein, partial [Deferribacterales bacterium]|nr:SEL1-like repeat protein [Deferribacterales bacterium]